MRKIEVESWVISVADRVEAGQQAEGDHEEAKSQWPDPSDAARQIAAHANAARGEPILWVIGADEKAKELRGADDNEFSNWHAQYVKRFDELAPEIRCYPVPIRGITLVGLLIETDRAPYVVKNVDGGKISREVPYRRAMATQSANRSDLIRILVPAAKQLRAEIEKASLKFIYKRDRQSQHPRVDVEFHLFLVQPQEQEATIRTKGIRAIMKLDSGKEFALRLERLETGMTGGLFELVNLKGPSQLSMSGGTLLKCEDAELIASSIEVSVSAKIPNHPLPLSFSLKFHETKETAHNADKVFRFFPE